MKQPDIEEFNNPDHDDPFFPEAEKKGVINNQDVDKLATLANANYKGEYLSDIRPTIINLLGSLDYETIEKAIMNASESGDDDFKYRPKFKNMFTTPEKVKEIAETEVIKKEKPLSEIEKWRKEREENEGS